MPYPSLTFTQLLSVATRQELEQFISLLQGYLSAEHKEDGSHAGITADSVAVTGDVDVEGDITADGTITADADGTPIVLAPDGTFGPGVRLTSGTASSWRIEGSPSAATLTLRDLLRTASHADTGTIAIVRTASGATGDYTIRPHASYILLSLGTDSSGQRIAEVNSTLTRAFTGYYERARTAAVGEFTTPAFNAANFTASTGNWTVDSGDVGTYAYSIVGKTMTVLFEIMTTDVSATPATLNIAIPGGFTAAKKTRAIINVIDAGATLTAGIAVVLAGGTTINCSASVAGAAWSTTAADNTHVLGQITFEVQ